jgi:hypothetical protein
MFALPTLALLGSLVMGGAGIAAIAAIAVTVRDQLPAMRKVLADARMIAQDREFLVQIVSVRQPATPRSGDRVRQLPARTIRPVTTLGAAPLRAAA